MKNILDTVTLLLVVVGALNWGLVGLIELNLVTTLFGATILTKIIYILVGGSGLYVALNRFAVNKKLTTIWGNEYNE